MPEFMTIRQAAKMGLTSETDLRARVRSGRCPGVYHGNRFLVNIGALAELLDEESRRAVKVVAEQ